MDQGSKGNRFSILLEQEKIIRRNLRESQREKITAQKQKEKELKHKQMIELIAQGALGGRGSTNWADYSEDEDNFDDPLPQQAPSSLSDEDTNSDTASVGDYHSGEESEEIYPPSDSSPSPPIANSTQNDDFNPSNRSNGNPKAKQPLPLSRKERKKQELDQLDLLISQYQEHTIIPPTLPTEEKSEQTCNSEEQDKIENIAKQSTAKKKKKKKVSAENTQQNSTTQLDEAKPSILPIEERMQALKKLAAKAGPKKKNNTNSDLAEIKNALAEDAKKKKKQQQKDNKDKLMFPKTFK